MSFLSRWFGPKYDDGRIATAAQKAIVADPLVTADSDVTVSSAKGVVTLEGLVHKADEKDRIEGVIRSALKNVGLKFDHIDNQIKVTDRTSSL